MRQWQHGSTHITSNSYPPALPGKNALRLQDDPDGQFTTPLKGDGGQPRFGWERFQATNVDVGHDNLHVRLVSLPRLHDMLLDAAIGNYAHVGGATSPLAILDMPVEEIITLEEFQSSGLEQTFESQMVSFLVYGCSRGFTHEIVRTRNGASFNQQTFRHTNLSNTRFRMPKAVADRGAAAQRLWTQSVLGSMQTYESMIDRGVAFEDARTVMPIGTETFIEVRMPWRTFVDLFAYRACYMFYPEMVWIMHEMYREIEERSPRLASMLSITCEKTKVCEYRGAEPTSDGSCPYLWAGRRKWMPPVHARRSDMKHDLPIMEWDKENPASVWAIDQGLKLPLPLHLTAMDEDGLMVGGTSEWDVRR